MTVAAVAPAASVRTAAALQVDRLFLSLAAASLVVGVSLGMYMGMKQDFMLAPVHAHLNLLGWASLGLFGLAYRAYPDLGRSKAARVHLALSGPSAVLFPAAIYMAVVHDQHQYVILPAVMWLAGAMLFLALMLGAGRSSTAERPA
jgi:hypothetical protein